MVRLSRKNRHFQVSFQLRAGNDPAFRGTGPASSGTRLRIGHLFWHFLYKGGSFRKEGPAQAPSYNEGACCPSFYILFFHFSGEPAGGSSRAISSEESERLFAGVKCLDALFLSQCVHKILMGYFRGISERKTISNRFEVSRRQSGEASQLVFHILVEGIRRPRRRACDDRTSRYPPV